MKSTLFCFCFLLFAYVSQCHLSSKRVIGYVRSWEDRKFTLEQGNHLTNVMFSFATMDESGTVSIPTDGFKKQLLDDILDIRRTLGITGQKLEISIVIGGWHNSQHFSRVARDQNLRRTFIRSVVQLMQREELDGVDIEWLHPVTGGATNNAIPSDKANYVLLLSELRDAFEGKGWLISIAGANLGRWLTGYDIDKIVLLVDWIGVRAIEFHGSWSRLTGPNAALFNGAPDHRDQQLNVDWIIEKYLQTTNTSNKIILGVPFFGVYWKRTNQPEDVNYPQFRTAQSNEGGIKSYNELKSGWLRKGSGFNVTFDESTKTPFATNNDGTFVSFENPKSIVLKAIYVLEKKLGGIMFWAIDQDDYDLTLLKSIGHVISVSPENGTNSAIAKSIHTKAKMAQNCDSSKRVIGYHGNESGRTFSLDQAIDLTNVIYAFATLDSNGVVSLPAKGYARQLLADMKLIRSHLRSAGQKLQISIVIGGWITQQHISHVADDANLRANFVTSVVDLMQEEDLDGVDIDWEHPVIGRANRNSRPADRENYVQLLTELRSAFGDRELLISIAAAHSQWSLQGYDLERIVQLVDWIGVMAYDFHGSWSKETGPNAPLFNGSPKFRNPELNADWITQYFVQRTGDSNKIILGVPFYGIYWNSTGPPLSANNPQFRIAESAVGGSKSYKELKSSWLRLDSGFEFFVDEKTGTSYATNADGFFLSYDDAKSIALKAKFAVEKNLGGLIIWSVEQDDDQLSLLKSIGFVCGGDSAVNRVDSECW